MLSAPTDAFSPAGRVESQDPAVVHDGQTVTELIGLFHVVRGEKDRLAVAVQLAQDLPQRDATLGVEACRRFVQEQDVRPVQDRPGHHQTLGHPARQREDRGIGPVGQVELLQELLGC